MQISPSRLAVATALSFAVFAAPVFANESDDVADQTEGQSDDQAHSEDGRLDDDFHNRQVDYQGNIIVSAEGLKQLDILAGTSVFEAEDIQRNLSGQIGEVLTDLPGVSATSFSPGASRPVLRGFQGERVRILVDGLGSSDVSNTSADHATTIDPLTAERIEVLRGPAVLLYGSQAIGGAVNVIDKRIPRRVPEKGYHLDALAAYDSVNNQANTGASLDLPISSNLVFHADGTYRQSDDLEIGGYQLTPELRSELLADADAEQAAGELDEANELRDAANQSGVLPGSATETYTINSGISFIQDGSVFGASIGYYNTDYGVPERPGAGHHGEEDETAETAGADGVSIGLEQFRTDFLADIKLGDGFFDRLKVRAGYSDYTHTEFEGAAVGTVFDSESLEGRLELVQSETGPLRGSVGLQYTYRDFTATGDEAFIPPNVTDQFAVFALQEYGVGPVQFEVAARYESTSTEASEIGIQRDFDTVSGALGLVYEAESFFRAGFNVSRVERAPSAEELFANGPHIATQAFEIGNPNLSTESAWGLEGYVRGELGAARFNLAVYQQWFSDYIYQSESGLEQDDLPVFSVLQQDANYFGVEGDVTLPLLENGDFEIITDLSGSYINAELGDGTSVPRIPPIELTGALEFQSDPIDVRGEVQWFGKQDNIAAFETPTDAFTMVNFLVAWRPLPGYENVTIQLAADNVFDVIGRRHASFTKDFVPLAGRNFRASVRLSF